MQDLTGGRSAFPARWCANGAASQADDACEVPAFNLAQMDPLMYDTGRRYGAPLLARIWHISGSEGGVWTPPGMDR
eukprot:4069141-Pyramimonas_sp.AAC.3